ncbi:ABC transporter substrate-binding protein [Ancylobacter dichloromethanicus]|uniref:ABC transporter ATP-binding protein n=1 Tax=Ancylobacter dichloromethanicus TaxID=518825 RepID=A0A9W6N0V8_9HYPH|nr:ABC transporter substrate-binding protein [Ancylobacter dichloromethanicus]MBS7552472.1 ABC transporter substrate-binding protein [Ancylobacter dichloromethanicus]GLK74214.1 ABC transporter ATP-binding protein [Ancylobacter dichloromethanicus]
MFKTIAARAGTLLVALTLGLAFGLAPAAADDKLTVLLDWYVNPDHAPLIIAQEKGFFKAHDLDVELVAPADPSAPPRLVAAGQADIAVSYQPNLYLSVKEGLPLVRFGTLISTPLTALVVLKDGPITSIADLKGKTVGYSVAGLEDALLGTMLASAGLKPSDVTMINVNFALSPALVAGKVDAVIGAYRNFELTQIRLEGKEGRAFFPEEHGVPVFDELIYVTRKDMIADPRLKRFLAAVEEATIYILNHPDDAWALFVKANPKLDDELNRTAWTDTLRRFTHAPAALDEGRYARFGDFMKSHGLIDKVEPVSVYAPALP